MSAAVTIFEAVPEMPTTFPRLACSNEDVEKIEAFMFALSKVVPNFEQHAPVTHWFQDGVYMREILMLSGQFVVGHEHLSEHHNLIISGRATVVMDNMIIEAEPGMMIRSRAGVRKLLMIHEPMRWMTIHKNPWGFTKETLPALEAMLFRPSQTYLQHKAALK